MMRRRRGPGLLGVAAVAGTAAYVGNKSAQKGAQQQAQAQAEAQQEAAQNQQLAELQAQNAALAAQMAPPQAPPPAAAAPAGIDMAQLKQLGDLHTAGILSDEEFAAAKAKLLG